MSSWKFLTIGRSIHPIFDKLLFSLFTCFKNENNARPKGFYSIKPFILRRQWHKSWFFQNCGTFCFNLNWKYHHFRRIEIFATAFLKRTVFRCKIQGCVKNICHVSFNYKLHCIITYSRQTFEFMLMKVKHVRVKHCTYALERIYLVLNHHSQRKVIAVPGELKFIFNS